MMTRPRMIERWFPCEEVSANSSAGWGSGNSEASLFTWFAKRPLAQAKAAVITSLLPWPDDPDEQARLQKLVRDAFPDPSSPNGRDANHDELLAELAKHYPDGASLLDPFSGRAMIPLEAARLGVKAIGIDYSPVATLAGQLLADYPLREWADEPDLPFAPKRETDQRRLTDDGSRRLLRDVEAVLDYIGDQYEKQMDEFYPKVDGKRPWGYLWAVTLPCQECGRRFPLTGSLVLRRPLPKKNDPGQSYRLLADPKTGDVSVVVHDGPPLSQPTLVTKNTKGKVAVCPFAGCEHPHEINVYTRLMRERKSEDRLLLVGELDETFGKVFREPTQAEYEAVRKAEAALALEEPFAPGMPAVPDEKIPAGNNDTVRPSKYGYRTYGELCNARQTLGFVKLSRLLGRLREDLLTTGLSDQYSRVLVGYAAAVLVRRLRRSTRGARLQTTGGTRVGDLFVNESSIGFSYDFFETGCGDGPGTWRSVAADTVAALRVQTERKPGRPARIERGSAIALPQRSGSIDAVVTDPPYDAMIDYSDASDLFYVWLKRALVSAYPALAVSAHPAGVQEKAEEIIVKRGGTSSNDHRTSEFYHTKLKEALAEARRVISPDGVVTIVFGHNSYEVWQRLLQTITDAGLILTGNWPAQTEKGGGGGSRNIVTTLTLCCRPAPLQRPIGRSAEVVAAIQQEVRKRIPLWEQAGLAEPDQKMAAFGPAMEIVGRYEKVLNNKGEPEEISKFLLIAMQEVENAADIRIDGLPLGTFDARTRFALSWVRQHRRELTDASAERWQRLSAQSAAGSNLNLDGLVIKMPKGVRFVFGRETDAEINRDTPVIDVVLALARAGKSLASAAKVLSDSGRADDQYLWSAIIELGRLLAEGDEDGDVYTWLTRNRRELVAAAASAEALRAAEKRAQEAADKQLVIFEQEDEDS